jgi:tRNA-specific 2-thiouridylase
MITCIPAAMTASSTIDKPLALAGVPAGGRVVVAMSGGVDSSLVAALVKAAGYETIGITLQLYDHGAATARKGACCAGQDIHDARRVADAIGIPHYVLDYEKRFRSSVIDAFAESYVKGETPVPCVACNQTVKFRDLLGVARELGAAALATGHYVESRPGPGGFTLHRAADATRDQSWFLFQTTREQLGFLRFPLGAMHKSDVRELARALALPVAGKPDSQDICFVPEGRYQDVIERLRPGAAEAGRIVHIDGQVLGRHQGIINFTIGQRKGLGIASGAPLFVVRLDADRREVVVGPREALLRHEIRLSGFNWLGDGEPRDGLAVAARIRSTAAPEAATLRSADGDVAVALDRGEHGVSPGQACVLYDSPEPRARVLGGGFIREALPAHAEGIARHARQAAITPPSAPTS